MNSKPSQTVYNIPSAYPFLETLAKFVLKEYGHEDFLSDIRILLPTRRAARELQDIFLKLTDGKPLILPQLLSLGDVDVDEIALTSSDDSIKDIPPAILSLRRQILLCQLIEQVAPLALDQKQAFALAGNLGVLIDQIHTEESSFDRLDNIVEDMFSDQWALSLKFLNIIRTTWPEKLAELGMIDAAERRKRLVRAMISFFENHPPETPVIAAGSTGSIPFTADLLATIAELPKGCAILPGIDLEIDAESWSEIGEGHPQATLKNLLERMGLVREKITFLPHLQTLSKSQIAREQLWREVLRPPEMLYQWQDTDNHVASDAFDNLHLLQCDSDENEAHAIALVMRETLEETRKTCALVTPDRMLAGRVKSYLKKWGISIDDSAGVPLKDTMRGQFAKFVLQLAQENFNPVSLLDLMKHPLMQCGLKTGTLKKLALKIDREKVLRGLWTPHKFENILANGDKSLTKDDLNILQDIFETIKPLHELITETDSSTFEIAKLHIQICERLARTEESTGESNLWRGEDGEKLSQVFQEILSCFSETALSQSFYAQSASHIYMTVFEHMLASQSVRPKFGTHPRLSILGQLEARLIHADRLILSGLNENTWPALPQQDPWMSRQMRTDMGLPPPERSITLSAHDFVQGACAQEVFLTRSTKNDGVPTVPARWLLRLQAYCTASGMTHFWNDENDYMSWVEELHNVPYEEQVTLERPYPCPPIDKRPTLLSVSSLEKMVRDPYALYARKILNVSPLEPYEEIIGAKHRGSFIHDALHTFSTTYPNDLPEDAYARLLQIGKDTFGEVIEDPALWVSWWPRYENLADWFISHEKEWRNSGYRFAAGEKDGTLSFKTEKNTYTLFARADRIDQHKDGHYAIIDYKTGSTKLSQNQIKLGFLPQLPVEALILRNGEAPLFGELTPHQSSYMGYWMLNGGSVAGREDKYLTSTQDIDSLINDTIDGLQKILSAYENPARGYPVKPFAKYAPKYNDYDHLSREQEWGNADSDDIGDAA